MPDLKTEIPGLFRAETGALINKDNSALQAYKARKQQLRKVKDYEGRILSLEKRVALLEEMIAK